MTRRGQPASSGCDYRDKDKGSAAVPGTMSPWAIHTAKSVARAPVGVAARSTHCGPFQRVITSNHAAIANVGQEMHVVQRSSLPLHWDRRLASRQPVHPMVWRGLGRPLCTRNQLAHASPFQNSTQPRTDNEADTTRRGLGAVGEFGADMSLFGALVH